MSGHRHRPGSRPRGSFVRFAAAVAAAACVFGGNALVAAPAMADDGDAVDVSAVSSAVTTVVDDGQAVSAADLDVPLTVSDQDRAEMTAPPSAAAVEAEKAESVQPAARSAVRRLASAASARSTSSSSTSTSSTDPTTGTGGIPVGGSKIWFVFDSVRNTYVTYRFTLRALRTNVEVWVQDNLDYPAGDCRNDGVRNVVTATQAQDLADVFQTKILPVESDVFSVATPRDGSSEQVVRDGSGYFTGKADSTVVLVDNIRDADYYTPTAPAAATYLQGFFSPALNEALDRNVMSIDSYDWTHRTGANPPATTATCLPRPASPQLYERIFAHEYQHLLEYYQDASENTWLNEGLSTYAQTLTGFSDTRLRYPAVGADSQLNCFQGFLPVSVYATCGPENSLTRWNETSVPGDYGAAYSFLTYVADRFGVEAITALHRSKLHGLASLDAWLVANATRGLSASDVVHDWAAAMAVDGWIDDGARGLYGNQRKRFSARELHSAINWDSPGAYAAAGAPANGSDYVLAPEGRGRYGCGLESLSFSGGLTFSGGVVPVAGWSVQLVGWSDDGRIVRVADLPLNGRNRIRLTSSALNTYLAGTDHAGVIITADDPTETATAGASYELRLNGKLQPGG